MRGLALLIVTRNRISEAQPDIEGHRAVGLDKLSAGSVPLLKQTPAS